MRPRLRWGLIGGGEGSQIGGAHRIAARLDGLFELVAGALDIDPVKGREFAMHNGITPARAYGDWREMIECESVLDPSERLDLVTVATPNSTHFEITKAFLEAGFDVLCEKPLTTTLRSSAELVAIARDAGRILAVNYGYTGYPLVRQARAMVQDGALGAIRVVVAEFAHGSHADAAADNPGCAGGMTRRKRESALCWPTPVCTRCTWPASLSDARYPRWPPISRPASRAACLRTTQW